MANILPTLNLLHWLAAAILVSLGFYCRPFRKNPVVDALALFFFLTGGWALTAAVMWHLPDLGLKVAAKRLQLLFPIFLPFSVLTIALALHGAGPWRKWLWRACLVVPLVTAFINVVPSLSPLFMTDYRVETMGPYHVLAFSSGPWFAVHSLHARVVIALAILLIATHHGEWGPHHRRRTWLVNGGIFIPFVGDTLAVYAFPPLRYIQITPALLFVTAMVMVYAILRHQIIAVVPFARSQILDGMDDLHLVFDDDGKLVDFNATAGARLGLTKLHLSQPRAVLFALHPLLGAWVTPGRELPGELLLDGEAYEVRDLALSDHGGRRVGGVLTFKNVTQRKVVERELEAINQTKTKLLAIMGHDLQGNLASTALIADNVLAQCDGMHPEDLKAALANIRATTRASLDFVDQLLAWSKSRMGMARGSLVTVSLDALSDQVLAFLQPAMAEKAIQVQVRSALKGPVRVDADALAVILRNLLSNALKYTPEGGHVTVDLRATDGHVAITVEDDGVGIAKERLPGIFDVPSDAKGGIGLYLSRAFAERMGGHLWAESEVNVGSRFHVSVPLMES